MSRHGGWYCFVIHSLNMSGVVSLETKQPYDNFILCERMYVTLVMSAKGKFMELTALL